MVIKIDVDGVIRDLVWSMCLMYNDLIGDNKDAWLFPEDINDYNVDKFFPVIKERFGITPRQYFFEDHGYETFRENAQVLPFAARAIQMLKSDEHQIVICTWQFTHENKCATLGFLDDWCIPYDDICFTKDKWIVNADIMIDDNPEFLLDKRDTTPRKILIDQPYNKNCNIERFDSLQNAVLDILQLPF